MTVKTIFLDRDGVINKEVNYLNKVDDFEFIDEVFSTCYYLKRLGFEIIIVTNQSGIGRCYFHEHDYLKLTSWMLAQFKSNKIEVLDVFYCPHSPSYNCLCRKPKPGMFIEAKNKHNIKMAESWMIGDSERDVIAASSAGIKNTILVRSGHEIDEENSKAKFYLDSINDIRNLIKY